MYLALRAGCTLFGPSQDTASNVLLQWQELQDKHIIVSTSSVAESVAVLQTSVACNLTSIAALQVPIAVLHVPISVLHVPISVLQTSDSHDFKTGTCRFVSQTCSQGKRIENKTRNNVKNRRLYSA